MLRQAVAPAATVALPERLAPSCTEELSAASCATVSGPLRSVGGTRFGTGHRARTGSTVEYRSVHAAASGWSIQNGVATSSIRCNKPVCVENTLKRPRFDAAPV